MWRFVLGFLVLLTPGGVHAQERAAFIVGNGAYEHAPPLLNPTNDAHLIARTLEELEFEVHLHENLPRREIASELSSFLKETEGARTTLFYFAGHGMQFDGRNYLLGTDAELRSELDIEAEALDLEQVTRLLRRGSRAALVFIDACRDNPLASNFYRENFSPTRALANRGLAAPDTSFEGAMLTFAASPGQVAYDGTEAHSPFASALARHLPTPNAEVLTLMKRVIRDVKQETGDRQVPMVSNDLTREIYLNLEDGGDATAIAFAQEEAMYEAALALSSERAWDIFLDRFPDGRLHAAALAAREELEAQRLADLSGVEARAGDPIPVSRDVAVQAETELGMARDDARDVQVALNARGYDAGPEDGVLGTRSRRAIADFQAAAGLPSTGVVTKGTAAALSLDLDAAEESGTPIYSSRNARRYDHEQLAMIESDPRLIEAARLLSGKEFVYGFFKGRLYIALLNWTWEPYDEAKSIAARLGGHLATLTSDEENQFAFSLVRYDRRFWKPHTTRDTTTFGPTFGLYQIDGGREPDGGWRWVTGEPLGYTNWLPGSPINANGDSQYAGFIWDVWPNRPDGQTFSAPTWHDFSHATPSLLIEIE